VHTLEYKLKIIHHLRTNNYLLMNNDFKRFFNNKILLIDSRNILSLSEQKNNLIKKSNLCLIIVSRNRDFITKLNSITTRITIMCVELFFMLFSFIIWYLSRNENRSVCVLLTFV